MKNLQLSIKKFIRQYVDLEKPLLMAISGGVDSLALLYLIKNTCPEIQINVAHVDHGWRKESCFEAQLLKRQVEEMGGNFHLKTLDPSQQVGNLENACRQERYQFFKYLVKKHNYQAVLLAHQQEDQVETILKRVFEGADLTKLSCMQPVCLFEEMKLLRPLLEVSKNKLEQYVASLNLAPFCDLTNFDTRYLRANMRQEIIPFLNRQFGKNIAPSLLNLAKESKEFTEYMMEKVKNFPVFKNAFVSFFEMPTEIHKLELKYLVKKFLDMNALNFSKDFIELISAHLLSKSSNINMEQGTYSLFIDQGKLFYFLSPLTFQRSFPLQVGCHQWGSWKIEISDLPKETKEKRGWQQLLNGEILVYLDHLSYVLEVLPLKTHTCTTKQLSKWYSANHVPTCMRSVVPCLTFKGRAFDEFLTGKTLRTLFSSERKYSLKMSYFK